MRHSPATLGAAALALLLAAGTGARADWIPWSYNWSRSPGEVLADNPATGGKITLTDEGLHSVIGDSDVVATNLRAYSTATASNPDHFTNKQYTLTMFLQDTASGQSGTVSFTGVFNGTLTATNANITNTYLGPTTQELVLGNNLYTVTIGKYAPPGPPGSVNSGSISAHAAITVQSIIQSVPEPASLTLACLALPLLSAPLRGRRRAGTSRP
jgi:hypothetical protein